MQTRNGVAGLYAAEQRPSLTELLARYPRLDSPAVANVSTRHQLSMANRANTTGDRLRQFLLSGA